MKGQRLHHEGRLLADTSDGIDRINAQPLALHMLHNTAGTEGGGLGAAMFAAVAAGVYKDINEATRHMGSDIEAEYRPDEKRALIYEKLYKKYLELAKLAETIN